MNPLDGLDVGTTLSPSYMREGMREDPFTFPGKDEILPDFTSVAMLPLKMSLYANTLRSSWYGMRYVSSIKNRFTPETLMRRYRYQTVNGLLAHTANAARAAYTGMVSVVRGDAWKQAKDLGDKSKPWKFVYNRASEKEFMKAQGSWTLGFMDKRYINTKNIEANLKGLARAGVIDDKMFRTMTTDNAFANTYARELYTGKLGKKYLRADTEAARKARSVLMGKTKKGPYGEGILFEGIPKDKEDFRRLYKQMMDERRVSVWDILKGDEKEGAFFSRERMESRSKFFKGREKVRLYRGQAGPGKRLTLSKRAFKWNKTLYGKMQYRGTEAAIRAMQEFGIDTAANSAVINRAGTDIASGLAERVRTAKMLRAGAVVFYGLPMLLEGMVSAYKKVNEFVVRAAPTIADVFRPEFGSGEMLDNSRMASERQRAVAAIQNAHMNARYLMGNEAAMYH